ncbi:MAG: IPT/TIG domain-containing protein [Candidatus Solibacter sp.]
MKIWGRLFGVCLGSVCLSAAWGQQYTIKTIAGNGTLGNVGSGDAAASQLNSPGAVVLGPNGDLYIADTGNHCIRKISGTTISTVAGTCGTIGQSGEGLAATSATLNAPAGLAFDSAGNMYIADTGNSVIRKVTGTTITRVAGQFNQAGYGGDNGAATSSNIDSATAVAFDAQNNLYIADTNNNLVRKVDAKTQIITSFVGAGTTDKRLDHPNGLWFDASGALYIANSGFQSVSKYVAPTLSLFAGNQTADFSGDGGPALRAQLNKPTGAMGDAAGNIYIADANNSVIRKVTAADGNIATIAGRAPQSGYGGDGGIATDAFLSFPRCLAVSSNGTIFIADTGNHAIRQLTPTASTISISGVTNAASFTSRVSPGALATIFGTGLANSVFLADDGFTWPTTAKQVTVRVNGVNSPLYYVSPTQINFQVPWETAVSGTANVSVLFNGAASNTVAVPVATAAPGLFTQDGAAIAQNAPDYSLNSASNPAPKGSTIVAYLTGSGPLSVAQKNGVPASLTTLVSATSAVTATLGSAPAIVSFTGLTPGFIGLLQMNIVVPATLAPGVYPLAITIDGQAANTATIAVK